MITRLLLAGLIPDVILGLPLMALCCVPARLRHWPIEQLFAPRELGRAFVAALPSLTVPVVIIGGIFSGIFTATEAAGMAAAVAFVIGFVVHRELSLRAMPKVLIDAAVQTAVVMVIVAASAHMGSFISNQQIPQHITESLGTLTRNPLLIPLLLNV